MYLQKVTISSIYDLVKVGIQKTVRYDVLDGPLKLDGEECEYKSISTAIYAVDGVVTHGLVHDVLEVGVVASPLGPRIIEWVKVLFCCSKRLFRRKNPAIH